MKTTLIDFIASREGFRSKPYKDSKGVPTIGYGSTYYANGVKVTMYDKSITQDDAKELLIDISSKYLKQVQSLVTSNLTPYQLISLTSFAYNVGINSFKNSTLLKEVNKNPDSSIIESEFKKWVYSGGKLIQGLVNRRKAEFNYYKNGLSLSPVLITVSVLALFFFSFLNFVLI